MSFLDLAIGYAALGLYVFPVAGNKAPLTPNGFHDAALDPRVITQWWERFPDANVGLAAGKSGKAVLDIDHGLMDEAGLRAWCQRNGIPTDTYIVRSGSRPDFKVHLYFDGAMPDIGEWELDGCSGQVKSLGGYVLAAGSIARHSSADSAPYEVLAGELGIFAPLPEAVRQLRMPVAVQTANAKVPKTKWTLPVSAGENRTGFLMEQAGFLVNVGCRFDAIYAHMADLNSDPAIIADPLDSERLENTAHNAAKLKMLPAEPKLVIASAPVAERKAIQLFHSREEAEHTPDISFAIEGFLQNEGITGLSAPPGQRKTIILLNVVRALMTGDALFGKFKVLEKAKRVIYLTPEVSLSPFVSRLRQFDLMDYIGGRFFFRTLSASGKVPLYSPELLDAVQGAHVILDTVPRFVEGDENDAEDIRKLGENLFAVLQAGARSVIGAFHMPKGAKKNDYFDLETCVRGSGDLGALLSACWGTRLQDEKDVYHCASYMECVKQRDFEACAPFELMPSRSGLLTACEGVQVASLAPGLGNRHVVNKDGQDKAAVEFIRAHPEMTLRHVEDAFVGMGIKRKKDWIGKQRRRLLSTDSGTGGVLSAASNQSE